jgi:hypothetical protein
VTNQINQIFDSCLFVAECVENVALCRHVTSYGSVEYDVLLFRSVVIESPLRSDIVCISQDGVLQERNTQDHADSSQYVYGAEESPWSLNLNFSIEVSWGVVSEYLIEDVAAARDYDDEDRDYWLG